MFSILVKIMLFDQKVKATVHIFVVFLCDKHSRSCMYAIHVREYCSIMLHVLLKCNLVVIQADTSCMCVTGVPSFLTSAGMLVMFRSSMSSCQRLESCPSSIGSSWIPGLLQRQEGFKPKHHDIRWVSQAGEMNKPVWYCILVWLLQLSPTQPWITRCDSWALVQNLVQCLAV